MFAYAGITVILMIILLANSDKYMFSTLMHYSGSIMGRNESNIYYKRYYYLSAICWHLLALWLFVTQITAAAKRDTYFLYNSIWS